MEEIFHKYAEDNNCVVTFDDNDILLLCRGATMTYTTWVETIGVKISNSFEK